VPLEAGPRDADRLLDLTDLSQLLGKVGEQPGAGVPLEALPKVVNPGVSHAHSRATLVSPTARRDPGTGVMAPLCRGWFTASPVEPTF
jgi:hypothetical protein